MKHVIAIAMLLVFGTVLSGCSKCDPWWGEEPTACRAAAPVK